MLKRIDAATAITSLAIVACTAIVQLGATKRTEIEAKAQLAIAQALAGKSTRASITVQVESKRDIKEELPDVSAGTPTGRNRPVE